jgi:hypothetical protein
MATNFRRTKLINHMRSMVHRSIMLKEDLDSLEKDSIPYIIKHAEMLEMNGAITMLQHEFKIKSAEIGRSEAYKKEGKEEWKE